MIRYDADPSAYSCDPLVKFDGSRWDKDSNVFNSFEKARQHAMKLKRAELKQIQDDLTTLEGLTAETTPLVSSPFI